ncbi:MAG: invasion associated locus B family protein [Bradyrhizobium sp.]
MPVGLQPAPRSCPSGLSLDAGITLAVDDRPDGEALRFRTCLPVGCIVSLCRSPSISPCSPPCALVRRSRSGPSPPRTASRFVLPISLRGLSPRHRLSALAK